MRCGQCHLLVALVVATSAPAGAADLTPLFPDDAWMVIGFEVKAIHESPLGRKVIGKDSVPLAARKLLTMFGVEDTADHLKSFAALDPLLEGVTRLTAMITLRGRPRDYEDAVVFLEGEFDDAKLAKGIESLCKQLEIAYKVETIDGRVVHVAGGEKELKWMFRVDKGTVALAYSRKAVEGVLACQAGKKKSQPPKAFIEWVKAVDPKSTPAWVVVGVNRSGDDSVLYSRLVATLSLGDDLALNVKAEAPNEAAAKSFRELLQVYPFGLTQSKDKPTWNDLGNSARIESNKNMVTATAKVSSAKLIADYKKQK